VRTALQTPPIVSADQPEGSGEPFLEFIYLASQRDAMKIARHFSAGISGAFLDESHRDD
jgi:hypothetical protein